MTNSSLQTPGASAETTSQQTDHRRQDTPQEGDNVIAIDANDQSQIQLPLQSNEILSWTGVLYDLLKQAGPNALRGSVVATRYVAIAYFLGRIDERLLAPNTLVSLVESLLVVLGSRSLNSVSAEIGRLNGATQLDGIGAVGALGAVLRQGSVLAAAISIPICAMYYFANHRFLELTGQHEFAVDEARKYFQAAMPGFLALMLFTVQQRFFQGIKQSTAALYSSALHSALIVGLSYPFMFGKLGLPQLGLTGAGYAFTAATWLTLISHTVYLLLAKSLSQYKINEIGDTFNLTKIIQLARVGIPSGIQSAMENAANLVSSLFLGHLGGLNALTADQVALQVAQVVSISNNGLGGAINPCVSNARGAKKYTDLRRYGYVGMLLGTVLPTLAFSVLLPLHQSFTHIFIDTNNPKNAAVVDLAKYFLLLEPLRQLATGWQATTSSALQGLTDTKFPMIATIACAFFFNLALLFSLTASKEFKNNPTNVTTSANENNNTNLEILYALKAVGFFMAAIFNLGRFVMKSHEVSDADKAEIKDKSLRERFCRGVRLLCSSAPRVDAALRVNDADANNLYAPLMSGAR